MFPQSNQVVTFARQRRQSGGVVRDPGACLAAALRSMGIGGLVPALMKLLGGANWWMPKWTGILLRVQYREPATEVAAESA